MSFAHEALALTIAHRNLQIAQEARDLASDLNETVDLCFATLEGIGRILKDESLTDGDARRQVAQMIAAVAEEIERTTPP